MIKVLAWGDGPTATTGFGRVTREVLKSLHSTGEYEITSLGVNYFGVTPDEPGEDTSGSDRDAYEAYQNYKLIPAGIGRDKDPFGRSMLLQVLAEGDYDVVWILQDTFNVVQLVEPLIKLKREKGFKVIFYFPIDSEGIHDHFLKSTRMADAVVVYNDWTKDLLLKMMPNELKGRIETIYHGYNPEDFYELSEKEKSEQRKIMLQGKVSDDDILVLRSDSNQQRKDWYKTFQIMGGVMKKNPKVKFYANTTIDNPDFPLFDFALRAGMKPGENFFYLTQFTKSNNLTQDGLNKLYNIADIGISTARGEGCGLFHYEMMALGKTLLLSDNTSHTEAIKAGAAMPINQSSTAVLPNDLGVARSVSSVSDGIKQMEYLTNHKDQVETLSKNANTFMKDLTWDKIGEQWIKLFAKIASKPDPFIYKEVKSAQESSDELISEYAQLIQDCVEVARKQWVEKYGFAPPEISYIGKDNEKKNDIIVP